MPRLSIRRSSTTVAFLCCWLTMGINAFSADTEFQKTAHVYKTVDDVKIHVDLHRAKDDAIRPCVVWIHGGALIVGSRESVPANLLEFCRTEGYALVSVDYRLAPEVKLPEIARDLDDALAWIRGQGVKTLKIDPQRLVIAGGSAGGFCTYLVTSRMKEKPRAIVSYWGYGEFDPDWTTVKSKDHGDPVAEPTALAAVHEGVITAPTKEQGQTRGQFYRYARQQGIWSKQVTGLDPVRDKAQLDPYCPVRQITKDFPPTLMVHGTLDTDVPYACSERMAEAFRQHGVPYELVTVERAGHGLSGGDPERNQQAHQRALAFIREKLQ